MANFVLQVPNNLRTFTVSASVSSNGSPPLSSSGSSGGVGGPVILELPLDKIRRPLMRTRANDPIKVQELMDSISEIGLQTPIDVLEVEGVYYGFSGCHRYEAHQRLGLPTIRCKIRRGTKETLRYFCLASPPLTSYGLSFRVNLQFLPSYAPCSVSVARIGMELEGYFISNFF
ncbi:hypothetical protein GBA52_013268 [Prunus armeniaca]|nr:hypothetical protein GBA52_013268 [Prunus armeniaca]